MSPILPAVPHQCDFVIDTQARKRHHTGIVAEGCLEWWCRGCRRFMPWCWGHADCALCDECCRGRCMSPRMQARLEGRPEADYDWAEPDEGEELYRDIRIWAEAIALTRKEAARARGAR